MLGTVASLFCEAKKSLKKGKIGDSYSLEVATTAHVTPFFLTCFWVSPLFFLLFISHLDVTGF